MEKWCVRLQCDLLRGTWIEEYHCYPTHELWYILATRGKEAYIYFKDWLNDEEGAREYLGKLLDLIEGCSEFTPQNKPTIWLPIVDTKVYVWRKPWEYKARLFRTLNEAKWRAENPHRCAKPPQVEPPETPNKVA